MNPVIAQLTARSLLGRRRALLLAALPAVLLILAVIIRATGGTDDDLAATLLQGFALGTLVPLVALIAGTGAIGPEIDDGSVVYLLAKPVSRYSVVVTKFVVAAVIVTVFAGLPTLLAGVLLTDELGDLTLAYALGVTIAGIAYSALFILLAVLTRNAVVIGLLYAIVWETIVGGYVPGAQALSVQQWALAQTESALGSTADALGISAAVGPVLGAVLLVALTVLAVADAGRRLRSLRLAGDD